MQAYGLRPQGAAPIIPAAPTPSPVSVSSGMVRMESVGSMMARAAADALAKSQANAQQPVVQGLAAYVRDCWTKALQAKEPIERQMLKAVLSRRGEYTPEKLQQIRSQGGSEIYMMVFSTKARQAGALMRDTMINSGVEKPWTLSPTAVPDVPPDLIAEVAQAAMTQVAQAEMSGLPMSMDDIRTLLSDAKARVEDQTMQIAKERVKRMETKMEDQLQQGGFLEAFDQFIDDLTTFKSAFLKGPVVRRRITMRWDKDAMSGYQLVIGEELALEWERVDPFHMYPAPWSRGVNDAWLIERHQLPRGELEAMRGVEGYNDNAIVAVLDQHGKDGLHQWLNIDTMRATAEGRDAAQAVVGTSDLIDALQFWGPVSGKMLLDWGMDASKIADPSKEYEAEVWLVGAHVIKCVVNSDPLKRRPYYSTGFERIPGSFWHNSLFDIIEDCQDMCNAAARALANNLGIASGPQVAINVERMPAGEKVTEMYPWKLWQTTSDPMGSTAKAIDFFQPQSNADQLMTVYERFAALADEWSGIPRYMAGFNEGSGGAGRTASGMSMMIGNAGKSIKQVLGNVDIHILTLALQRLYFYNMRYLDDPDLKGDINVIARGALSLAVKEAAQVRRNEFLQATANPFDMQIVGLEGRAEVLRASARGLDLDVDKIVPSGSVLKIRAAMAAQQAALAAMQGQGGENSQGTPPKPQQSQQLMNGAPQTDHFQPA